MGLIRQPPILKETTTLQMVILIGNEMKKITNIVLYINLSCLLFLALSSCNKDQQKVSLKAQLSQVSGNEKLAIDEFMTYWSNGDLIFINTQPNCAVDVAATGETATIADVNESNSYHAIFPSDIVLNDDISNLSSVRIELPSEQQYELDGAKQKVKIPMGAVNNGRTLQFHNLCSLLKVTVSNSTNAPITLSSIEVSAMDEGVSLSGRGTATVTGSLSDKIILDNGECNWVSLEFSEGDQPTINNEESKNFYIVLPSFGNTSDLKDLMITIFTTNGYSSQQLSGKYLPNNRIATVNCQTQSLVKPVPENVTIPEGAIPGVYSINASQKVFFSKGNLQFNAVLGSHAVATGGTKNGTWRFAEHQYDICGSNNQLISSTYNGWIDLFGWGTSGFDNTAAMSSATNYEPYCSNTSSGNYGPTSGYSLAGEAANYDWGVYNTISTSPNTSWRTMTFPEWKYIMSNDAGSRLQHASIHSESGNTSRMVFTKARIGNTSNSVNGVLLFPDEFVCPVHFSCSLFQNSTSQWTATRQIPIQQFKQFEKRGCVFLPAAGRRDNTNLEVDNSLYWTSSLWSQTDQTFAKGILITSDNINYSNSYRRAFGASVRLVHVIQ